MAAARAAATGSATPTGKQFVVTAEVRQRLADWRGTVVAVHRELVDAAKAGGPPAPSPATLFRVVNRQLSPGDRAGLRKGEHVARAHDVFLQWPSTQVWLCQLDGRHESVTCRPAMLSSVLLTPPWT